MEAFFCVMYYPHILFNLKHDKLNTQMYYLDPNLFRTHNPACETTFTCAKQLCMTQKILDFVSHKKIPCETILRMTSLSKQLCSDINYRGSSSRFRLYD